MKPFHPYILTQFSTCLFVTNQVGKSRYGDHSSVDTVQEERDQLILEDNALKSRIIELEKGCSKSTGNTNIYETIQSAFEMIQQNPFKVVHLSCNINYS